ncbi:MAG: zinc-ribbon domain-containing protein, partial [Myxococcales bacterium]|nr:zinc-ribbon domain-containing protein [Myxococcales bacterium]
MFCPNCGTQNVDTVAACVKCGFNVAGAATPKFKGTMLMGQGAVPPGAPPAPAAPYGAPPAPPAPGGYGA